MTLIPHLEPESTRTLLPDLATAAHIHELLRSNAEAPDDLPSIFSVLADELVRYDEQITRLKARLTRTESDRSKLKAHYDSCRGLLAPVRRMPPELFVKFFALCRASTPVLPPNFYSNLLGRLAHQNLLTISQVCARWRDLALGTPTLWDTFTLHKELWSNRDRVKKVLAFLNLALERGGRSLLKLEASGNIPELALHLLATHSERWRAAEFSCDVSNFHHLANAKGKLPFLQSLKLDVLGKALETIDIFGVTPNLTSLTISRALICEMVKPPLHQLRCFTAIDKKPAEVPMVLSLVSGPSHPIHLGLEINLSPWIVDRSHVIALDMPSTTSDILSLSLTHCIEAFDAMSAGLTLPHLRQLTLWIHRVQYPEFRLPWRHAEFLAFSMRSSFHTHLKVLHLPHVLITEKELVECLLLLPRLHQLNISDHQRVKYSGEDHILMTSSLFQSRTRTADSMCLFLLSRSEKGCTFESKLFWFPRHGRELCPDVTAQIQELRSQRQLAFSFDEWDYEA
ncbi:hypothetical protein B0H14DRAFT_3009254 [Mycena olivaceomarginata]|nr:hypothetical protein B0H14DRAFT_3009254 [Mycena olivaceomarginata]